MLIEFFINQNNRAMLLNEFTSLNSNEHEQD